MWFEAKSSQCTPAHTVDSDTQIRSSARVVGPRGHHFRHSLQRVIVKIELFFGGSAWIRMKTWATTTALKNFCSESYLGELSTPVPKP